MEKESEIKSNGVLVNSFYELESGYADHYRKVLGRKAWHIGPFWFWNCDTQNKAKRGLAVSGQQFIWVVKKNIEEDKEDWLPEGYEKRIEGRGLIIRRWTPQLLILEQETGGFVIHCGWNSTLEAIIAGVPMVTWPVSVEQFYNEKLVTGTLNIGVRVGVQKGAALVGDRVKKDAIEKVIT